MNVRTVPNFADGKCLMVTGVIPLLNPPSMGPVATPSRVRGQEEKIEDEEANQTPKFFAE